MTGRFLQRWVDLRAGEAAGVAWAFAYFFSLLCGYYVIRPVREEMGIAGGVDALPWLFTATFVTMLAAVPIYSAVVARAPRATIVPIIYRFFALNLVAFFAAFTIGFGGPRVAQVFFVWTAVYNLFVVSVFWSFMADLFTQEQGRRLFGFIAAGGTAGALAGPSITALLVTRVGAVNLLLLSALLLEVAVWCIAGLRRTVAVAGGAAVPREARPPKADRIGGGVFRGIGMVFRTPFLGGIAAQTVLFSAVTTFSYFQQQRIVAASIADGDARTALFAKADLAVNLIAIATQSLVTGPVLSRLGVAAGLAAVPLLSTAGFVAVAAAPLLWLIVAMHTLRRALHYGLERPARETLFTVVGDEERFKAKGFIDTVVYRGGDAASGWAFTGLKAVGLSVSQVALSALPLSLAGVGVAWFLGRRQAHMAAKRSGRNGNDGKGR